MNKRCKWNLPGGYLTAILGVLIVLSNLFCSNKAFAQSDITDSVRFDPVEVVAARSSGFSYEIPTSISVLNIQDIQTNQLTLSIEESLRKVPGVFVNNRYNLAQGDRIIIRGLGSRAQFGVRNIKIVQDDIPLTFADGITQLNNIDLSSTGKMEVLRGPASALYGNSAGGAILIQTEIPDTQRLHLTGGFTYGSYGFKKTQLKANGTVGNTAYLLNSTFTDLDGYRAFSESRMYHVNGLVRHHFDASTQLSWLVNLNHSPFLYSPGGLNLAEVEEDRKQAREIVQRYLPGKAITQGQSGLSFKKDFGRAGRLQNTIYGIYREMHNPIFGRAIDLQRFALGTRNVFAKDMEFKNAIIRLTTGLDLDYQNDFRKEHENIPVSSEKLEAMNVPERIQNVQKGELSLAQREEILNTGLFASLRWKWKKLSVTGGLRYDYFRFSVSERSGTQNEPQNEQLNFSHFSPSVGLLYQWSRSFESYANYSTAFQTPTANEFSNDPTGSGFNNNLNPEILNGFEAGLRFYGKNWKAEAVGFYFTVSDQLIPYQASMQTDEIYYRNAGQTENKGLELWFQYAPISFLDFTVSYTFMDYVFIDYLVKFGGEQTQLEGNQVPGVPAHQFFGSVAYRHQTGISAELQTRYTGSYFANDFNGHPTDNSIDELNFKNQSYFLIDLRLGYAHTFNRFGLNVFGGLNNLFDEKYNGSIIPNAAGNRFFEPAPGRNFYVGARVMIF